MTDKTDSSSSPPRAASASMWILGGTIGGQGIRVVGNLILTRLLYPEVFGLMAVLNAIQLGLQLFSDIGLRPSVIRSPHYKEPSFMNTVWTLSTIRGLVLWVTAGILAYPMASLLKLPDLAHYLPVLSLSLVFNGLQSPWLLQFERELKWKTPIAIQILSQAAAIATMVVLSFFYVTPWSIIAGSITGSLVTLVCSHYICRHQPLSFSLDRDTARDILHFGKWVFLSTILTFSTSHLDQLLLARTFPLEVIGFFSLAKGITALFTNISRKLQASILFPVLSTKSCDGQNLREAITKYQVLVSSPLLLLLAIGAGLSETLVSILYDTRYHDAGWIAELLFISFAVLIPFSPANIATYALNRPARSTLFLAVNCVLTLSALAIGSLAGSLYVFLLSLILSRFVLCGVALHTYRILGLDYPKLDIGLLLIFFMTWQASTIPSALGLHIQDPLTPAIAVCAATSVWGLGSGVLYKLCGIDWKQHVKALSSRQRSLS